MVSSRNHLTGGSLWGQSIRRPCRTLYPVSLKLMWEFQIHHRFFSTNLQTYETVYLSAASLKPHTCVAKPGNANTSPCWNIYAYMDITSAVSTSFKCCRPICAHFFARRFCDDVVQSVQSIAHNSLARSKLTQPSFRFHHDGDIDGYQRPTTIAMHQFDREKA